MTTTPLRSIRGEVDEYLHPRTNDKEWAQVLDEGDAWVRAADPAQIASHVESWRRARRRQPSGEHSDRLDLKWVWARSLMASTEAAEHPDVVGFRAAALASGHIDLAAVEEWIAARRVHPATWYARMQVPHDLMPDIRSRVRVEGYVEGVETLTLAYPSGDGWTSYVPTQRGDVLDDLRQIGERLAARYGWQPAQATAFVLSGVPPLVPVLTVKAPVVATFGVDRVVITVDPDVPVEAVQAAFLRARHQLRGTKPRSPKAERVELVIHAESHPGSSDHALRMSWNREHPDDQFGTIGAFRQALRDARRRVGGVPRRRR